MPNSRYYSSIAAATNLQVTANPGDTSIQVASSVGWPGSFPFIVSLDYGAANEELVLATSGGPAIFSVTRAYDGTPASTHNAGAVVRHVSSAIDFTDSRTHESSNTGVHGISGQFVDTTSVQTISNKTLTAPVLNNPTIGGTASGGTFTGTTLTNPTINAAALSGTVTGSPTLTGVVTFSGAPVFTGGPSFTTTSALFSGALVSSTVLRTRVTGDTNDRFVLRADGGINLGSGAGATDVVVNRGSAGFLNVGGSLSVSGSVTATANLLGDDLSLNTTNFTTYTPAWGNIGSATFSTNTGYFKKFGKMVYVVIYGAFNGAGSGSSGINVTLPSIPFRAGAGPNTTRQVLTGWNDNMGVVSPGLMFAPIFAGDTTATTGTLRAFDNSQFQGGYIQVGTILTIEGWYREA